MKKLFILLLVLSVCSMATATVYWQGGTAGEECAGKKINGKSGSHTQSLHI